MYSLAAGVCLNSASVAIYLKGKLNDYELPEYHPTKPTFTLYGILLKHHILSLIFVNTLRERLK